MQWTTQVAPIWVAERASMRMAAEAGAPTHRLTHRPAHIQHHHDVRRRTLLPGRQIRCVDGHNELLLPGAVGRLARDVARLPRPDLFDQRELQRGAAVHLSGVRHALVSTSATLRGPPHGCCSAVVICLCACEGSQEAQGRWQRTPWPSVAGSPSASGCGAAPDPPALIASSMACRSAGAGAVPSTCRRAAAAVNTHSWADWTQIAGCSRALRGRARGLAAAAAAVRPPWSP